MSVSPNALIDSIGDTVDGAIITIGGAINDVRDRASGADPCARFGMLNEARTNVMNSMAGKAGTVAAYRLAGERAVEASIANQGRPTSAHQGGQSFAQWLADTTLPTPPGAVLASILGGPAGIGAAAAWVDWLDNRLPAGRPSGNNSGTRVFGLADVRVKGGRLQGSAVRAAWDAWAAQQARVVWAPNKPGWRTRVERVEAKLELLEERRAMLDAEIEEWGELCKQANAAEGRRIDLTLQAKLDAVAEQLKTERIRAIAPYALGGLILLGIMRRSR